MITTRGKDAPFIPPCKTYFIFLVLEVETFTTRRRSSALLESNVRPLTDAAARLLNMTRAIGAFNLTPSLVRQRPLFPPLPLSTLYSIGKSEFLK